MKIAIATFAGLPNPPVKGGAVETLIDDLCIINELENSLTIDVYSVYDSEAAEVAKKYKNTEFLFYQKYKSRKISKKNVVRKLFKKSIPDKTMSQIVQMINRKEYDYVIITSINYEMEYIFQKVRSKVIWYLHGDPLSVLRQDAVKRISDHCYAVITVSDFVKKRVTSVNPQCKVITVRNCTDLVPVSPEDELTIRQSIREKIGAQVNDKLFVYIGRITPIKGIYELVQAFSIANIPNTKLLIVGAPSDENEKKYYENIKSIASLGVKYWGYATHSTLNEIYCAADCIVAPSMCQEAALLIALEASICRRPLITTNIGGIPEYVDENAIMIEYNDSFVENIAEAMKSVCCMDERKKINVRESDLVTKYYDDFFNTLQQLARENV